MNTADPSDDSRTNTLLDGGTKGQKWMKNITKQQKDNGSLHNSR